MSKAAQPGGEERAFTSASDFKAWLDVHYDTHPGLWLRIAKAAADHPTVSYPEAVEVALCFGWIDGQKAGGDETYWLQRFTPRSARSRWSKINRDKAEALTAAGRMRPGGQAEIERAKGDGRWASAYEGQARAVVPDDLQRELDRDPQLATAFAALDSHNRYGIVWRLNDAKRPATRARRLATYLDMLRRGGRLHG